MEGYVVMEFILNPEYYASVTNIDGIVECVNEQL
jgi:transcription antitermination factor NusG